MADSEWSFFPKSVSAHLKPNSNPRSDIENAPPLDPNIHIPRNQSVSKSPAFRNQIDSASRRRGISALKSSNEVEEASNPHVKLFMGSCRGLLGKSSFLFEERDRLAEELKREIHGLKKMREMMMDELVDKEMSSSEGRWLDFERETYEEGIDIEGERVSTLLDDLVNDLVSVFKEEH